MKKGIGRGVSQLPVPKASKGSPLAASSHLAKGRGSHARSAEDIPRHISLSVGPSPVSSPNRRAISPGSEQRKGLSPLRTQTSQIGVRYITEDLIKKISKEENFDRITNLNLTLAKEGMKKIKYIENLERLRKLQVLNLSNNMIEKVERLDKLLRLKELNLSYNSIVKIEGLENLVSLQLLNVNGNLIEHIPPWLPKRLKALRKLCVAKNSLASLTEVSKLKVLCDLTQLDVSDNPLSDLPHSRFFIIFHLRTVEILNGHGVGNQERDHAEQRFAQEELERVEKQLEQEEVRSRRLEESQNQSLHEKSLQEAMTKELKERDRRIQERVKELERELNAKSDLLRKKTEELNRACEKHYQLEQELAFYKIDSKFESLGEVPRPEGESGEDSGLLGESPYIGRARYRMNQFASESLILQSPQKIHIHSLLDGSVGSQGHVPEVRGQLHQALEAEILDKQREVTLAEERLRDLQGNLSATEEKLARVVSDLKTMTNRKTPEPFQGDNKFKVRQKLARKMKTVNEMRDGATQVESDIDRMAKTIKEKKTVFTRLKDQVTQMDSNDPNYRQTYSEMVDKEQQINESNQIYSDLQKQLTDMMDKIATENADINKMEQQLRQDYIEQNETLQSELDDIISGLQGYIENVQMESTQQKVEIEKLSAQKEGLEGKVRKMEAELSVLDSEAGEVKSMQQRLAELQQSLRKSEELNQSLNDQLHHSRQLDPELQDRLEQAEMDVRNLRQTLADTERRAEATRKALEKKVQSEREKAEKVRRTVTPSQSHQDHDVQKLVSQLEKAKTLNASLREQLAEKEKRTPEKPTPSSSSDSFRPSDLKRRLRDLTHNFRTGKKPIEPAGADDILGKTFKDLHVYVQEKLNSSTRENEQIRKSKEKADAEVQALREELKKLEPRTSKHDEEKKDSKKIVDNRKNEEYEMRKLEDEVRRLKNALKEAENRASQGFPRTRIVYAPGSDTSFDRASSLNSEEKRLFDELQRELMELKRNMRNQEEENMSRLQAVQTEAERYTSELEQKERVFEEQLEKQRQEAELMREKQEVRIQVIAEDLDQAQGVVDHLHNALQVRENHIQDEQQHSDLSNQIVSAQEEEVARLYEILETQRSEIEGLNQMLDYLAQQGPDGVGPNFDDELWRLRQEVNSLKETLAMQSAYVQTMPHGTGSTGTQATPRPPPFSPPKGLSQPTMSSQPSAVNTESRHPSSQAAHSQQHLAHHQHLAHSQQLVHAPRDNTPAPRPQTEPPPQHHVPASAAVSTPIVSGNIRTSYHPQGRIHMIEHTGTERRESKVPPGGRSNMGRSGDTGHMGPPPSTSRPLSEQQADDAPRSAHQMTSGSYRSRPQRQITMPSAFEPVYRPAPQYNPPPPQYMTAPPPVNQQAPPPLPPPPPPPVLPAGMLPATTGSGLGPMGPSMGVQTSGVVGPSPGVSSPDHVLRDGRPAPYFTEAPPVPVYMPQHNLGSAAGMHAHPGPYFASPPPGSVPFGPSMPAPPMPAPPPMSAGLPNPHISFNPGPAQVECSYPVSPEFSPSPHASYPGSPQTHPAAYAGAYNYGNESYTPAGPAQNVAYRHGESRFYVPVAGSHPSRLYYPVNGRIAMPASVSSSPGPRLSAMTPVATGTPVHESEISRIVNYDGSFLQPPSPIRPVAMDSPVRGILKNGGTSGGHQVVDDDSYLFCNVPEHHDLEDYIAELQEKLKRLKIRITRTEEIEEEEEEHVVSEDQRLVRRLQRELEERRDELEALDLAIERQKENLSHLQKEEKRLEKDRRAAKDELNIMKIRNEKITVKRRHDNRYTESEDSFDEALERNRQKFLRDELDCLEKTLAKRTAQLHDTERLLKECNVNLKEAKEQARDTVQRYDDATAGLQTTAREAQELEKRATDAGVQLIKTTEQLATVRVEVKELDRKKAKQERLLKDIMLIITKKDAEFKELDSRVKSSAHSLQRMQSDLSVASKREKETVDALRESDDLLSKRRSELAKLRDQLESERHELEKLDELMGKKKTELQLMMDAAERRQSELSAVLREAEVEITNKHRELRDQRDELKEYEQQKLDVMSLIKSKRLELAKVKDATEQEEEVLQRLVGSVNKNKAELKHIYDRQTYEQTELDSLKSQHSQKLVELEKTQRALLDEKSNLEQMNIETNRKGSELERLRQTLDRDRQEIDHLTTEKQSLEDRINALAREKDVLNESCKNLDDKLNQMKRSHIVLEEKIGTATDRLERLEAELQLREREMDDSNHQKTIITKEINSLKATAKGHSHFFVLEMRETCLKRDDALVENERLRGAIQQSRFEHDDVAQRETDKKHELTELIRHMEDKATEYQDAKQALNKVKLEAEKEEGRLNRLVDSANIELAALRTELTCKREELERTQRRLAETQQKTESLNANEEKFVVMDIKIKDLESEIGKRNEEKSELAKALTMSYEELQKLRQESAEDQEHLVKENAELQSTLHDMHDHLELTKQELTLMQQRFNNQVTNLEKIAGEHFSRANQLSDELCQVKKQLSSTMKQMADEDKENMVQVRSPPGVFREPWRKEALKEKLEEEQDYLRYQLHQQMLRHSEAMETTRLQSEGTIESLKRKLNTLQEVLFNSNESADIQAIRQMTNIRSRSKTPPKSLIYDRKRSPSPLTRSTNNYLTGRRSRSTSSDRLPSPMFPERDFI
ncbi:centriolin-like [Gigantopelta aegis]|uniref:centriolin-like n=1 Tax=Gigantopelta aegis TaxID=1735272 RepID=UPI001B887D74|nr:centriolin-like [Gigantopelta aegis]